jgi:23S rRNA (adenine2503-C2)-methyltransferase
MEVYKKTTNSDIATVYLARNKAGKCIEFVESTQPPFNRDQKWVMIISTLFGCPVKCSFCDAGGFYGGKLSLEELLFQVDYMIRLYHPDGIVQCEKLKIQFARMGEPSFNTAVVDLLEILPENYSLPVFIPSISTVAPAGTDGFFDRLIGIKKRLYPQTFQLQFSIHSTDTIQRDKLIPVRKWDFSKISEYSHRFFDTGGKKITLNFALSTDTILKPDVLSRFFDPEIFIIKLTPVNPTRKARNNRINSLITKNNIPEELVRTISSLGYDVITSVGEWEENQIGSNCGQYVLGYLHGDEEGVEGYSYGLEDV